MDLLPYLTGGAVITSVFGSSHFPQIQLLYFASLCCGFKLGKSSGHIFLLAEGAGPHPTNCKSPDIHSTTSPPKFGHFPSSGYIFGSSPGIITVSGSSPIIGNGNLSSPNVTFLPYIPSYIESMFKSTSYFPPFISFALDTKLKLTLGGCSTMSCIIIV